ncbi:Pre-mRNA-splicing factor cwc26 [Xylographa carneopallida]|nr:Pre-mRNA-splicing factor cwc26 [Xylographa carneopallida]
MSLADYLAKNYLTADSKPEKKSKKRKRTDAAHGLIIADDDPLGWSSTTAAKEEDDGPVTVGGNSAEFRKAKSNKWQTIGGASISTDEAAADAILASVAAESSARALAEDDAPAIDDSDLKNESGIQAGLQSGVQVAAQIKRAKDMERRRFTEGGAEESGKGQETIYRDASGRIINLAMKRAEARKKAEEEAAKAAAELEAQKGDVQRVQLAKRREELAEAKFLPVARYADDEDLNDELKERDRWNDPAAQFLSKKKQGKSVTGKPLYTGPAMPNRYGIRPGYRWDGVDRGNGFEKEYFAAQNKRKNLKDLDYAWQMDE